MKTIYFTLFGLLMGAVFSILGSLMFSILVTGMIFGKVLFSATGVYMLGNIGLLSVIYSIIPCALAGTYCAYWLTLRDRTGQDVARCGLLVGAIAGLIISLVATGKIFAFDMNLAIFGLSLLAIFFTSIFGRVGAKFLARRLKSPLHLQSRPPSTES